MGRVLLVVAAVVTLVASVAVGPSAARHADTSVFSGLATWVDIYDSYYSNPEATAARIAARGVRTVFAETANDRSAVDVVQPGPLGRFVDALHAEGIAVVAWYLPGFDKPARDLRRTRAMLRFRTPAGGSFDAVALDIESTRLKNVGLRTRRLLKLSGTLRSRGGGDARGGDHVSATSARAPRRLVAAVPVERARTARRRVRADGLLGRRLQRIRRHVRVRRPLVAPGAATRRARLPIHAAGGVANRMDAEELRAFADAVVDTDAVGWSLYDYETTLPRLVPSAARAVGRGRRGGERPRGAGRPV